MEAKKENQGAPDPLSRLIDPHISRSDFSKKRFGYQSTSPLKASISVRLAIRTT
jgi:hypothetical protein